MRTALTTSSSTNSVIILSLVCEAIALILAAWTAVVIGLTRWRVRRGGVNEFRLNSVYYPLVLRTLLFSVLLVAGLGCVFPLFRLGSSLTVYFQCKPGLGDDQLVEPGTRCTTAPCPLMISADRVVFRSPYLLSIFSRCLYSPPILCVAPVLIYSMLTCALSPQYVSSGVNRRVASHPRRRGRGRGRGRDRPPRRSSFRRHLM
jgi:hypothetical protein